MLELPKFQKKVEKRLKKGKKTDMCADDLQAIADWKNKFPFERQNDVSDNGKVAVHEQGMLQGICVLVFPHKCDSGIIYVKTKTLVEPRFPFDA